MAWKAYTGKGTFVNGSYHQTWEEVTMVTLTGMSSSNRSTQLRYAYTTPTVVSIISPRYRHLPEYQHDVRISMSRPWYFGPDGRSRLWRAWRQGSLEDLLQVYPNDIDYNEHMLWYATTRSPKPHLGMAWTFGSAPGYLGSEFRQLSSIGQGDGSSAFPASDDGEEFEESNRDDADDDDNRRYKFRRQQRAAKAAGILLSGQTPSYNGYRSPPQIPHWRQSGMPPSKEDLQSIFGTSSTLGNAYRLDSTGRVVRFRRALSAPVQSVLDYPLFDERLVEKTAVHDHVHGPVQSKDEKREHDSGLEPFPPYHDPYEQDSDDQRMLGNSDDDTPPSHTKPEVQFAALNGNGKPKARPGKTPTEAYVDSASQPVSSNQLGQAPRTKSFRSSIKRRLGQIMKPADRSSRSSNRADSARSHISTSSTSSKHSALYHRVGSPINAVMDGPSPSTTYSPTHPSDTAPFPVLTPRPRTGGPDISPWIQNLQDDEPSTPESAFRHRHLSRVKRFFQKVFRRDSVSQPLGLKRLWHRFNHRKTRTPERQALPNQERAATKHTTSAKTRNGPHDKTRKATKPLAKPRPATPSHTPSPAVEAEALLGARDAAQPNELKRPPHSTARNRPAAREQEQKHEHRTVRDAAYDFLSPDPQKLAHAVEAAPLAGAANSVYMAGLT